MLRRPLAALVAALSLIGGALTAAAATAAAAPDRAAAPASAAAAAAPAASVADTYSWKNVQIGGGGFVPGIIFNQSEKNLAYARTDIGGAYRWNQSDQSWTPLLDSVGWDHWGRTGVVSLASDALAPDKVYAAVGTYTNDWDPGNGAVLRSSDRGATWQATDLPFKLGGNMPGRGMGERLAIDPNKDSVLYLGTPSGHGLWRSTDSGVTWSQVTAFPDAGNYADDPTDTTGYNSDNQGVVWVTFDPTTGTKGSATQTIYVGVADKDNTVFRSTDGGATWSRLAGQPTGYIAHKGVLDSVNGYLYIATSDTGGPYDGSAGQVWRYAVKTGTWTNISPMSDSDTYFGYSGLTIDREHPGTLMATGYSSWWPDTQIFRSTDSGATWTRAWDYTSYPNRQDRYTLNVSSVPWLTFGANPSPPEETPKLGWMTESLEIDPFDSNRMWFGTGATVYGTSDLTDWDTSGGKIALTPNVKGLEEIAVKGLISPPSGAPLLSALGDLGGFRHTDITKIPATMYQQPTFTTTDGIDYAESNPGIVVRVGDEDSGPHVAFSTDNGADWFAGTDPAGVTGGGTVAAAADGSAFLWSPAGTGVQHTTGFGSSWSAASGLPSGASIASDRVDAKRFYGFSGGRFYLSTDAGATFTATAASGLPSSGAVQIKALPGAKGDVWLAGGSDTGYGLWHSTDSGATFTKVTGVQEADTIGFGKAAPGASYPALYSSAEVGGVRGIYRSTDAGATWVRINDDAHQYGWTGAAITGDPRVYGRVYVGTNGRGIIYGDTSDTSGGGTTTPPTTPPTTPRPHRPRRRRPRPRPGRAPARPRTRWPTAGPAASRPR
ncbi:beta propeller repeat protein [Actinacidiphila yeochonensis]|uniref:xyloglucanase n=1 Tax=Actinacidiphila yeochonensis TaxID=89050 RepID=UPI000A8F091E